MHLVERYALGSGAKIDQPYILEKFFPHDMNRYITLHPRSKYDSKCYDYWQEVVDIIHPELSKHGIDILQIGVEGDPLLNLCKHAVGGTSIGQTAYILKDSELHLGADSFPVHVASHYNRKIVALYSNIYPNQANPYWGNKKDQILLEADREGKKPSYAAQENPKTINSIKPENIAEKVLSLLGLEYSYPYQTLTRGPNFLSRNIQSVPRGVLDIQGLAVDSIIMRMDLHFDENVLANQLMRTKCSILSNKPISLDIFKQFKEKINQFVYVIDENHNPSFIEDLINTGAVRPLLISEMSADKLNKLKIDYMDHSIIMPKSLPKEKDIEEIKKHGMDNLYYKSNKFLIDKGRVYPSIAAWQQEESIPSLVNTPQKVIDTDNFWKEIQDYYILKKSS